MYTVRLSDRDDWFIVWKEDKESILATMAENLRADLNAGYNYFGKAIQNQQETIRAYKNQFDAEIDSFKSMDEKSVNRWCYYDLIKRGAIA